MKRESFQCLAVKWSKIRVEKRATERKRGMKTERNKTGQNAMINLLLDELTPVMISPRALS